jgi:hypothetical protein
MATDSRSTRPSSNSITGTRPSRFFSGNAGCWWARSLMLTSTGSTLIGQALLDPEHAHARRGLGAAGPVTGA